MGAGRTRPAVRAWLNQAQHERAEFGVLDRLDNENWQSPPFNRYAFTHFDEVLPTAAVSRHRRPSTPVTVGLGSFAGMPDLEARLDVLCTDALLVRRGELVLGEYYRPGFGPGQQHLLMSVSKSLCGLVIGSLIDDGVIDPHLPVGAYMPALDGSAFADATVQQMLDMTTAIDYREDYLDPAAEVQTHDRAAGWRTPRPGDPADTYSFLTSLTRSRSHGEHFVYCSANTDALAWVAEEASGLRYADLLSERLWSRLGARDDARIQVDRGGFGFANGGVICTARDLERIGRLMLRGGELDGDRIVSESFVAQTMAGGDPEACEGARLGGVFPNGSYRNQWWSTGNDRGNVYAYGIHGQFLWLDPGSDTVIVTFSSLPAPADPQDMREHIELLTDLICAVETTS